MPRKNFLFMQSNHSNETPASDLFGQINARTKKEQRNYQAGDLAANR
jgi:hypothetical protein